MSIARSLSTLCVLAFAAVAQLTGCNDPGRFPTCKDDAECAARSGGEKAPHCFDLRCVPCRSDDDCGSGKLCNAAKECKGLSSVAAAPTGSASAAPAPPEEKETWVASTPEDHKKCLAACKNKPQDCKKRCGNGPAKTPPKK